MSKENIIERILKRASLETRLRVHLEFEDIKHWDNGKYSGDVTEELNHILRMVEKWVKDGAKLRD